MLPLVAACTTNFNRAALVPHAAPRMSTGQPLEARGQLSVGASSIVHLGDPEVGSTSNQGIEIPGTQLFGNMKARIGEHAALGFQYEHGFDAGAKKLNSSQPDVDNGDVKGYGFTLDVFIPTGDPNWKIGLGVDAMLWSCPYVSYETTTTGSITIRDEGSDSVTAFAASITPSYKIDKGMTVFGGLTVRNHPTIQQKGMGTLLLDDVEVESGPANYIFSAGVEVGLADNSMLLSAFGYYDASRDPAKYGPGMGVMLSVPLGRRGKAPPQQPPPPGYGPQPYPQPYPGQPYPPQPYPPQPQPYPPQPQPQPYPPAPAPAPAPSPPGGAAM